MTQKAEQNQVEKESPLRRPPLRQPGQSIQEEMDRLWDQKIDFYIVMALLAGALAFWDWWSWAFSIPRRPWITTLVAAVSIGYAVVRVRPLQKQHRNLRLGRDGERTVGQALETLRAKGFRVYHDFCGDRFNIDHIVIGPTGVFTVNTKTISKPKGTDVKIQYDGQRVLVPGCPLERDPIAQARAERDEIQKWIVTNANRTVPVRPAVVFVGWQTEKHPKGAEVWVLNVGGLLSFIEHEYSELSEDNIAHISGLLETHILSKQRQLYDKLDPVWQT